MALEVTIALTDSFGESRIFEDAFLVVSGVSGNKNRIMIEYKIYKNRDCKHIIMSSCEKFTPDLDGPNFIKQAYLYIKSMPIFTDARDC